METIDAVYVVGPKSRWGDLELRYSLRSCEKYGKGLGRVFIVGHVPKFIDKTRIVHVPENFKYYKERNIMECVKLACTTDVTDEFIFMNDDFYLWTHVDLVDLPYYARPFDLFDYVYAPHRVDKRWTAYTRIIERTHRALVEQKFSIHTFDLHVPMRYNKHRYPDAMDIFNWDDPQKLGFASRSLYGNAVELEPTHIPDVKVNKAVTANGLQNRLRGLRFWSTDNSANMKNVKTVLDNRFPEPSIYEI